MADNVVDRLSIEINADAKKAVDSLGRLETRLRGLASATKNLSSSALSITQLSLALKNLNDVKSGNITKLVTPLEKISQLNFQNISQLAGASRALRDLANVNVKDTGITSFVSAMARLSKVQIQPDTAQRLTDIGNSLSAFSNTSNISASVTRLISALARLASASKSIGIVTVQLPNFGEAIRKVATSLSQLGGVDPLIANFVRSLAQLAGTGDKMLKSAQNLDVFGQAILGLINTLNGANINEDVAKLVSAISELSSSMAQLGKGGGSGSVSQVTSNVSRLQHSFQTLGRVIQKVVNTVWGLFQKFARGISSLARTFIAKVSGMKEASQGLFTVSDGIKSVIGGLLGMRGITGVFNWMKEAVTAGGDITEINHIVESVFEKDMVDSVNAWAREAIDKFGIAEGAAKHYAGVLSSMFQASGIARRTAGEMSMDLVGIAADLSSFYNIDTETAYQKIKSGMAGMVRPLRDLGIDLSVASLQQYALNQGITKSVSAMTQAEKVMLRYNYLLEVTGQQQGDFAATANSFANALRTLKALAQSVTTQIGVGLAAALRHVIIFLREAMKHVLGLAQTFANFMQTLFGKYQGGAKGFAMEGLGDADEYANDLADATGDAASGLGDAADNAEQLRKELSVLPFDELNQLNKDREATTSSGGNGGSGGSGGGGLGDLGLGDVGMGLEDFLEGSQLPEAISKWGQRIRDAFLKHDWEGLGSTIAEMFNEGIQFLYDLLDPEKVKKKVDPYIDAFTTAFNSFVDVFNFELLGKTIARGINDIAYIFNSWYSKMNFENLGVKLSEGLNGLLVEGDFYEWGLALGNKFMIGWDIFAGFVSNEQMWHNLGQAIADGIKGLTAGIRLGKIGKALSDFINGICETLETIAEDDEMWSGVVDNIVEGINNFIGNTEWKEDGEKLNKFLQKFADALSETIDNIHWYDLGQGLGQTLTEIKFGQAIKKLASSIVNALGDFLKGLISEPGGAVALGIIGGLGLLKLSIPVLIALFNIGVGKTIASALASSIAKKLGESTLGKAVADSATTASTRAAGEGAGKAVAGDVSTGMSSSGLFGNTFWSKILQTGFIIGNLWEMHDNFKKVNESVSQMKSIEDYCNNSSLSLESLNGIVDLAAEKSTNYGFMVRDASDVARDAIAKAAADGQITSDEATAILENLRWQLGLTDEDFWGILDTVTNSSSGIKTEVSSTSDEVTSTLGRIGGKVKEYRIPEEISGEIGRVNPILASLANSGMGMFGANIGFGYSNSVDPNLKKVRDNIKGKFSEIERDSEESGAHTIQKYGQKFQNIQELTTGLNNIKTSAFNAFDNIKNAVFGFGSDTVFGYGNKFSDRTELNNQLNSTQTDMDTKFDAIKKAAEDVGTNTRKGIEAGLQSHLTNLKTTAQEMLDVARGAADGVYSIMANMDLSNAGRSAAQSFANGFEGVHIATPHMYISGWDTFTWGDGWQSVPTWAIQWYKAGGVFQGGKGQVIGIAEDNRDEAVLPLENKRAMSRIADSIVDSSGSGMGLNADDIADAVVQAMVMMQGNQQNPVFHIEVKTEDNEVLARAVTKGQQSIDYRNNPTPKFAY